MSYIIKNLFLFSFFYEVSILSSFQKTIDEYLKDLENPKKAALEYTTQKRLQVMQKIRDENFKKEYLDVIIDKKINDLVKKELDSITPVNTQEIQEEALKKLSDYYKNEINCKHPQDIKKSNFNRRVVAVLISMNDLALSESMQNLREEIIRYFDQIDPQVKKQKVSKKNIVFNLVDPINSIIESSKVPKKYFAEIALEKDPIFASVMIKDGFLARMNRLEKSLTKTIDQDDEKSFEALFFAMNLSDKVSDIATYCFKRNPHANNVCTFLEKQMKFVEYDKNQINSLKKRKHQENLHLTIDDMSNLVIPKKSKKAESIIDDACFKKHILEDRAFESDKKQKISFFDPAKYDKPKIYLR